MSKTAAVFKPNAITRIVSVNFSGNTGKTTLVRHLLMPMFPDSELIRIESINDSGTSEADMLVDGKRFDDVAKILFEADCDKIVDIGSSNVELVKKAFRRLGDAHEDVDMWLIPCTPGSQKIRNDTIATASELLSIGVAPEKIVILKNKVFDADGMAADFAAITAFGKATGIRVLDNPILEFDVYPEVDNLPNSTIDGMVADQTDYRAKMLACKRAGDDDGAAEAVEQEFRRKNARQALINLTAVRRELFLAA